MCNLIIPEDWLRKSALFSISISRFTLKSFILIIAERRSGDAMLAIWRSQKVLNKETQTTYGKEKHYGLIQTEQKM